MSSATGPTLAAVHALHLTEIAEALGLAVDPLLARCGLDREHLYDPGAKVPLAAFEALVEHIRTDSNEPAIGLLLGARVRVTTHGHAGLGVMAAKDLRQAIQFACRFSPIRTLVVRFVLEVEGDTAIIRIEERAPLGSARDVMILSIATGFWQVGNAITGRSLQGDLELAMPKPDYFARFEEFAPGEVHFDMPGHALKFPARFLDLPLVAADATAYRLACETCERELRALALDESPVAKLEALLEEERHCALTMAEAAKALGMSERTLKRRLAESQASFSQLLEDARKRHALRLIQSNVSVEAIAERLGYSDPTNFTRAFRRWTGVSPRRARTRPG